MTIKQQGGIFGRNPTFNDVDVEGSLTVDGSALPSVDNIAVLDTAQTFTEKQTLSKAGATFDIFNFEYTGAGDRITMGLDGYNSIMKLFSSNGSQSIQLSAGGANNSFFKGVDVEIHNANLVMATAGQGIDFSATSGTGTSELFNDYEEGTCVVGLTATSSGSITLEGSSQTLTYTKTGRQVTVTGRIAVSSVSSPSGALILTGLPFLSGTGSSFQSGVAVLAGGFAATATGQICGLMNSASTAVTFYKYASGGVSNLAGDVQAGTEMYLTITYFVG